MGRLGSSLASLLGLCLLTTCRVMSNPVQSNVAYDNYGPGSECEVGNRVISHGELFTDPNLSHCLVHQCYFGSSFLYSEGCEDSMAGCHGVGEQWEENCLTYTCTRTAIRGYNYYQPILQTARCRDADGSCHEQGQIFSYVLRGRRHNYCSCTIRNNRILYRCF